MTEQKQQTSEGGTAGISLYEFYVLCIDRLLVKAPWELGRAVSEYHEVFLTEQRCIGLTMLLLLGEEHVPLDAASTVPGFEDQARASVNQAVFMRALKEYFARTRFDTSRAERVLARMTSYIDDVRQAVQAGKQPLARMLATIIKRVPPKDARQRELYAERIEKMYDYIENMVQNELLARYRIVD